MTQMWMKVTTVVLIAATGLATAIGIDTLRDRASSPMWLAILATVVYLAVLNIAARRVESVPAGARFGGDVIAGLAFGVFFYAKQTAFDVEGLAFAAVNGAFIALVIIGMQSYWLRRWPQRLPADAEPASEPVR
ncbi:hypothetical protein [Trueperella pecoris]|uniref:Uncharacterized protein n=1 Tax=Trueperella pecoris TaxID=2733571 RepID=A0A7M1QUY5_9ACTO|nr:hypothetical protein [Trueperella pecoris]QOR45601.1 hypothetical protein INS88_10205 [Trueperella pecoris]